MLKLWAAIVCVVIGLEGCAHRGAVRVECDGPLRPINLTEGPLPVSVVPAPPSSGGGETQP